MQRLAARAGLAAADLLCPERCAACATIVHAEALFCHACLDGVNVLGSPECERCGAPLARAGGLCSPCAASSAPAVRRARAWAAYEPATVATRPVARALAAFKYQGRRRLGRRLAGAMLWRLPSDAPALIVPVPLHPRRLRRRGFNQSAVLARHLARALAWPLALRLLTRTRDTPSQTALSASERAANVADAFRIRVPGTAAGRRILLVDDVWTSGATARAAAACLRAGGAARVDVLTLARVL